MYHTVFVHGSSIPYCLLLHGSYNFGVCGELSLPGSIGVFKTIMVSQICSEARMLVGMLYRQFYSWADTNTLLIYCTCI